MRIGSPKLPRVSMLIPCFNADAHVAAAISCALSQTYGHVEVLVAPDDGETYLHLRSQFTSPQMRILPPGTRSGTGAGATRNRALDAATGEYFAMLDADDLVPPDYLEKLMAVALDEGVAVCNTRYVGGCKDAANPGRLSQIGA